MEMYKKSGVNLITRYTIEYIDNEKDFDYVNSGRIDKGEPSDRYKTKQFDNLDDAMSLYTVWLVNDRILDMKLFEEIILNGETIRESYIELKNTTSHSLKTVINKNLYDNNVKNETKIETLETENRLYKQFIDIMHADKMFSEYAKQNIEKKAYRYYSLERPVMPGSYPKKSMATNIYNYDNRTLIDDIGRLAWGYIEYSEPLTKQDCYDYELEPSMNAWKETKTA
jgi:hypothetical protein